MLERLKTYIPNADADLLQIILDNAEDAFEDYTGQDAASFPAIIFAMAVEDYNRYGSEGISSLSFGAGSESVLEDYSAGLQKRIRRYKKVRVL